MVFLFFQIKMLIFHILSKLYSLFIYFSYSSQLLKLYIHIYSPVFFFLNYTIKYKIFIFIKTLSIKKLKNIYNGLPSSKMSLHKYFFNSSYLLFSFQTSHKLIIFLLCILGYLYLTIMFNYIIFNFE